MSNKLHSVSAYTVFCSFFNTYPTKANVPSISLNVGRLLFSLFFLVASGAGYWYFVIFTCVSDTNCSYILVLLTTILSQCTKHSLMTHFAVHFPDHSGGIYNLSQLVRLWYLSHWRTATAQARLRIGRAFVVCTHKVWK